MTHADKNTGMNLCKSVHAQEWTCVGTGTYSVYIHTHWVFMYLHGHRQVYTWTHMCTHRCKMHLCKHIQVCIGTGINVSSLKGPPCLRKWPVSVPSF